MRPCDVSPVRLEAHHTVMTACSHCTLETDRHMLEIVGMDLGEARDRWIIFRTAVQTGLDRPEKPLHLWPLCVSADVRLQSGHVESGLHARQYDFQEGAILPRPGQLRPGERRKTANWQE